MMEHALLHVLFISELLVLSSLSGSLVLSSSLSESLVLSSSLPREYHFVNQLLNWTEAQTYCRQKFTDLATVSNVEESTLLSSKITDATWFGLYGETNWRWSDGFEGSGADYQHWRSLEPNNNGGKEICTCSENTGNWLDINCPTVSTFICNSGPSTNPLFVFVDQLKNWTDAQRYCRDNYVDLVTIRNDTENQRMASLVPSGSCTLIGLNRNPNFYWSDRSDLTFMNETDIPNPTDSLKVSCSYVSPKESYKWKFSPCSDKRPFVCQGPPIKSTKLYVKLKMNVISVDLNDENVKAQLLKKLQEELKANNVTGVTLKWREQPDGKVFHKDKK